MKVFSAAPALLAAVLVLAASVGCSHRNALSDTEKRDRIDSMYRAYHDDFPGVVDITAAQLREAQAAEGDGLVIVDVREPAERAISRIPGSIAKEEFESHRDRYKDKDIVVHCTIGYRSGVYAEALKKEGIDAKNLAGSILSWVHAGGAVEDSEGHPTKRVHVYGPTWDLLPQGYESVW